MESSILALPAPKFAQEFVPSSTALEKKIAAVWANVLGIERVGATDNFFELGGHSLLGLRLINQLREVLGEPLGLAFVFEAPTPASMAALFTHRTIRRPRSAGLRNESASTPTPALDRSFR